MTARLGRYLAGSFPPLFYLPYALAWSLGGSALFVLADPRLTRWRPGWATVATTVTFVVLVLLMRAVDDLRDLDYDRVHHPRRPLASGAVRPRDLAVLIAGGALAVLALNAPRGAAVTAAAAAPLGYALLLLAVGLRWQWPPGDDLGFGALLGLPVQLLLNGYLGAGVLHDGGLSPGRHDLLPVLTAVAVFAHLEYGRKLTRSPAAGERSYVTVYGVGGTVAAALGGAVLSAALGLLLTRPWSSGPGAAPWGWLLLAPLGFAAYGADWFLRRRAVRWPAGAAALFLICTFLAHLAVALLGKDTS
ncbi:hypothetical protein [Kitasatospora sp. KL5]|uniref:hypothetical protein n=1 Tax=Kitasatospora sp. KL5 TaxID=3425125 RepID=UPI003D6FB168